MFTHQYREGWIAHMNGLSSSNPYNESTQCISYHEWLSGWCERFGAVKRGHPDLEERDDEIGVWRG